MLVSCVLACEPRVVRTPRLRRDPDDLIAELRSLADPANVEGMARFGISRNGTLGISVTTLRRIARRVEPDHALAAALWGSGIHEARMLATIVEVPERVTSRQADAWARDLDSWDVCDGFAFDLMSRTPLRWAKPATWARSKREFVRRAAFSLIAGLAAHDKEAADEQFIALLPLVREDATDDRNFVKKAVNWALRQVGKRNMALNRQAVALARELRASESRAARWIGADALRELTSETTRERMRVKPERR